MLFPAFLESVGKEKCKPLLDLAASLETLSLCESALKIMLSGSSFEAWKIKGSNRLCITDILR